MGLVHMKTGKWDEAVAAFKKAIALKPDFALAHLNLGKAYYMKDMKEEANQEWNRARQIDPRLRLEKLPES